MEAKKSLPITTANVLYTANMLLQIYIAHTNVSVIFRIVQGKNNWNITDFLIWEVTQHFVIVSKSLSLQKLAHAERPSRRTRKHFPVIAELSAKKWHVNCNKTLPEGRDNAHAN